MKTLFKTAFVSGLLLLAVLAMPRAQAVGWVNGDSFADPNNGWTNDGNANDGSTSTYATNSTMNGNNAWSRPIEFYFNTPKLCSNIRGFSDFGYSRATQVRIEILPDGGSWTTVYEGPDWLDMDWRDVSFPKQMLDGGRFTYYFIDTSWQFWLYEFQFYEAPAQVNVPVGQTLAATSITETSAILRGELTSDGGEPCSYRFEYGLTSNYTSNTPWVDGYLETGNDFGQIIIGLSNSTTYHFRCQVKNSAGITSGADMTFSTGDFATGWTSPITFVDPGGTWQNETSCYDDSVLTWAKCRHEINDPVLGPYLELYTNTTITATQIRFYAKGLPTTNLANIQLRLANDTWSANVYNAGFADQDWQTVAFTKQQIKGARIRLQASNQNEGFDWRLFEFDFYRVVGVNISGACDPGQTVRLLVNGVDTGLTSTGSGTYTFNYDLGAGDVVVAYYDNSALKAASATVASTGNINNLDLVNNTLVVRSEDPAVAITNADLVLGTNGDADIPYTVSGSNITVSTGRNLQVQSDSTLNYGTSNLTMASGNITNNGTLASSATGTLTVSGTTAISGSGANLLGNLTIGGSGTLTAPDNLYLAGNFTNNNLFNANSGSVFFNGTSTVGGTSTTAFNNLNIFGSLTAPAGTMNVSGNWTNNGTFNANNGTVGFTGTSEISGNSTTAFSSVSITGSLTGSPGTVGVTGNWTNSGSFDANGGTVQFSGAGVSNINGNTTFNNLKCDTAGKTLSFQAGSEQTVEGTFTVTGSPSSNVVLKSQADGNKWDISFPNGPQTVAFADVKDSDANTNTVTVAGGNDSGNNNANWIFPGVRYWVGGDGNWSNPMNWSTTSGGPGGAGAPTATMAAIFDNNSGLNAAVTVDQAVNVASLTMTAGTTANIGQGANPVTIGAGGFSQAGGSFTGGSANMDFNGAFTQTGGSFQATTGNLQLASGFTHTGGTFTANGGTVVFDGTTTMTDTVGNSFNNITVTGSVVLPSALTMTGNLVNNGVFNASNSTVSFAGTTTVSGSGSKAFKNVTINNGATLTGATGTMTVSGNWANSGTYNHNSGTVAFNGTTSFTGSGANNFNNITISGTVSGPNGGTIGVAGNWVNSGTFHHNQSTVNFNGTSSVSGTSSTIFNNLTISGTLNGSSGALNVAGNWTNNGAFNANSGEVVFNGIGTVAGSSTTNFHTVTIWGELTGHATQMNVSGNWRDEGTFNSNGGTVLFNGDSLIYGTTTTDFNLMRVTGVATIGGNNVIADSSDVTVDGGTLNLNGYFENVGDVTLQNGGGIGNGVLNGDSYNVQSGSISADLTGTGALTKNTAGTVTLTGSNDYSGGTTVNAGTLEVTTNSLPGNATNSGTISFNQTVIGTYSGVISGATGVVAVNSPGTTVTLSGNHTYDGGTNIIAGTALLNGNNSAANGAVTVQNGAVLGGTGTLGGTITVDAGGTVTGATMVTVGNLTGSAGLSLNGVYAVTISGDPNNNDRLVLTGAAAGSGTVDVSFIGGYLPDADQTWTIITGGGGSDYANIIANSVTFNGLPDTRFTLTQAGNNLQLTYTRGVPVVSNGIGASKISVASALLNGEILDSGSQPTATVRIYWGTTDGGTTPGNWNGTPTNYIELTGVGTGTFSALLEGLTIVTGGTYFYRCYATHAGGSDWAESSEEFTLLNTDFRIQHVSADIANGSLTRTLTAGTHYRAPSSASKAWAFISGNGNTGAGNTAAGGNQNADDVTAYISSGFENGVNSITISRFGSATSTHVDLVIIEYIGPDGGPNEVIVRKQGNVVTTTTGTTVDVTGITGVADINDCVPWITGQANPDTGATDYNTGRFTGEMLDAANARFTRGEASGDACRVSYAIVEFTGSSWKIQRREHTYTAAGVTQNENITAANDTSRAFIHAQKRIGTGLQGLDEWGDNVWLSATNTVSFLLEGGANTPASHVSVAWVIENTQSDGDMMIVTRNSGNRPVTGSEPDIWTVTTGVDEPRDVSSVHISNRGAGTGTAFPRTIIGAENTSSTIFTLWRSDNGQPQNYRWEHVRWPRYTAPVDPVYYINIDGAIYTNLAKTGNIGAGRSVSVSVNGTATTTILSGTDGIFQFVNLPVHYDDVIVIYLDGGALDAALITQVRGADLTGAAKLEMFTDKVVLHEADSPGPLDIAKLDNVDAADNDNEDGITVSGGALTVAAGKELYIAPGASFTPGGDVTADHLRIGGTFTAPATTTINGNFTNSGSFDANGGTVVFAGTGSIGGLSTTQFNDVEITGTVTAPNAEIRVAGNWDASTGSFNNGNGTVNFNGTGAQSVTSGDAANDWFEIKVTNESVAGVSFQDGFTTARFTATTPGSTIYFKYFDPDDVQADADIFDITESGGLNIQGSIGNPVKLRRLGGSPGDQWELSPSSPDKAWTVAYADVQDSVNTAAAAIYPANSVNSGNNVNWFVATLAELDSFAALGFDGGVRLNWRTAAELNNAGFQLWRASAADGAYVNITPNLIRALGNSTRGRAYTFVDPFVVNGQNYWYKLEAVEYNGRSAFHGPVSATPAAGIPDPGAPADEGQGGGNDPEPGPGAGAGIFKILVRQNGICRITGADLAAAGLELAGVQPANLRVYNLGAEVPIRVVSAAPDAFGPADFIEFPAVKADSTYTDANVYWLYPAQTAGGLRIVAAPGAGAGTPADSFRATSRLELDEYYEATLPQGEDDADSWFFLDYLWSADAEPGVLDLAIDLPGVAPGAAADAQVRVALCGYTGIHRVQASLNGYEFADSAWEHRGIQVLAGSVPHAQLLPGANTLTLTMPGIPGAYEEVLLDWIEVDYSRATQAVDNSLEIANLPAGVAEFAISGFTANDIQVFRIDPAAELSTALASGVQIGGGPGAYTASFSAAGGPGVRLLAAAGAGARLPVDGAAVEILPAESANLRDTGNGADYIIIVPNADFATAVQPLADFRTARGLRVRTVDIREIYDDFGFGLATPDAVRNFLAYAREHWQRPAPLFVLLAGDGTYDPRNIEGLATASNLPVKMIYTPEIGQAPADNWFVCLDGDDDLIPDLHLGRFPARTAAELTVMVNKTIAYENASANQAWTAGALFVADGGDNRFADMSNRTTAILPDAYAETKVYLADFANATACGTAVRNGINAGALITHYAGHGSVKQWAAPSILQTSQVNLLTNADKLSFFVTPTCINGYFLWADAFNNESLAETLLRSPLGGAVACLSPTGGSLPPEQEVFVQAVFEHIFGTGNFEAGAAVSAARSQTFVELGQAARHLIHSFSLFGDPALRLKKSPAFALDPAPPQVTTTTPAAGAVRIDIPDTLRVRFDRPMDRLATEAAFAIAPPVPGALSWDGRTLIFTPAAPLRFGQEYTVTIHATARSLAGVGLDGNADGLAAGAPADNFEFSFRPAALRLEAGWNALSLPVQTAQTLAQIFSDGQGGSLVTGQIWLFDPLLGVYRLLDGTAVVPANRGLWVYAPAAGFSQPLAGAWPGNQIQLRHGLNLVGAPAGCLLPELPGLSRPAWYWDAAVGVNRIMPPAERLRPGRAYWLNASRNLLLAWPLE